MKISGLVAPLLMAAMAAALAEGALAQGSAPSIGPAPVARPVPGAAPSAAPSVAAPTPAARPRAANAARLDELKSALQLQPNQFEAWNAYEAGVKAQAEEQTRLRNEVPKLRGDRQAISELRATMLKHRAKSAEEINALRAALQATLTAEQKATFAQFRAGQTTAGPARDGRGA